MRRTEAGKITITLVSNPSHLEAVDPVVEGWTRAEQTDRSAATGRHSPSVALPILIHGDASFAGQGVVAETFNLEGLPGYSTGGTLHLIANNQVGFTTDPNEGRSTRYSSDLAKGFDAPIIHVNADDAEASISAARLALAFRERFGHDVVVDLVGYRRFGHNEQDEPAYTQPLMAQAIADQPTVRAQLAERLAAEGVVTAEDAQRMVAETHEAMKAAHDRLRQAIAEPPKEESRTPPAGSTEVVTAVAAERLRDLDRELVAVPDRFTIHPKLVRQLERRPDALEQGGIDWGHAEALALGSLLVEGIPVRLTGQDTERGTFSHRHLVLHDAVDRRALRADPAPRRTPRPRSSSTTRRSPSTRALGFDYGYSVAAPETLVLWEAQFGDFVNGAQIIIDQFLVSGLSKWSQTSRLTLLLPHGYEGNGPEHSSARLERFLQSAAQENIRVANPSTAAQYFHLLRRQALDARPRPLVTMTPKGLLRLAESAATLEELSTGAFQPVLDDPAADHAQRARSSSARGRSTTTSPATRRAPAGATSPSSASTSSIRSPRAPSPSCSPSTRPWRRSSGPRRSRSTWAPIARSATGSRTRCHTASRCATSAGAGGRARARAIRRRTSPSRSGSSARRSASQLERLRDLSTAPRRPPPSARACAPAGTRPPLGGRQPPP